MTAVEAAGLEDTLSGEGPLTVFVPNDDAFAALPEGQLDELLADPGALGEILEYHVVADDLKIADILERDSIETIQGESITVTVEGGVAMLNGTATFARTDFEADNGTWHPINAVLIPPGG